MRALPTPKRMRDPQPECPLKECLSLLAGAWTTDIIWYLSAGPRRFGDLRRDLGPVSAKVLSARLRELEKRGVVSRTVQSSKPPTVEYALTSLGLRLRPALAMLVEVGNELRINHRSEVITHQRRADGTPPRVSSAARRRAPAPSEASPA